MPVTFDAPREYQGWAIRVTVTADDCPLFRGRKNYRSFLLGRSDRKGEAGGHRTILFHTRQQARDWIKETGNGSRRGQRADGFVWEKTPVKAGGRVYPL